MKITLAKALKIKNRLAAKVGETSKAITEYNSVIKDAVRPVDINALLEKRGKLVDALLNCKTAISTANIPIQATIFLLSELKDEANFLRGVDTTSGVTINNSRWGTTETIHEKTAILDYQMVKALIDQIEIDIDTNQEKLDVHNYSVSVEIDESVMSLMRG